MKDIWAENLNFRYTPTTPFLPPITRKQTAEKQDMATLFNQLSFHFPARRWTCLLGKSGCGKTTLLRLIAGLETPSVSPAISSHNFADHHGNIAYMGQQNTLLPWASILENITLGARLRGEKPNMERAKYLLCQTGLDHVQNQKPAQLSGGMQQRCLLIRVLMEDRPIILLDEPFSALDALTRHELQTLTYKLLQGRTVIHVTHDPLEALRMGDDLYILKGQPAQLQRLSLFKSPPDKTDQEDQPKKRRQIRDLYQDNLHLAYDKILTELATGAL